MTIVKEVILHWACDILVCREHGSGAALPEGWTHVSIGRGAVVIASGHLCPKHAHLAVAQIRPRPGKKEEEVA